jgi:hypothetical protein
VLATIKVASSQTVRVRDVVHSDASGAQVDDRYTDNVLPEIS